MAKKRKWANVRLHARSYVPCLPESRHVLPVDLLRSQAHPLSLQQEETEGTDENSTVQFKNWVDMEGVRNTR